MSYAFHAQDLYRHYVSVAGTNAMPDIRNLSRPPHQNVTTISLIKI